MGLDSAKPVAVIDYRDLKVTVVNLSDQIAGIEQVQKQLCMGLAAGHSDVEMITMSERNREFLTVPDVRTWVLEQLSDNKGNPLSRALRLKRALPKLNDRIVNLHYPMCDLVRSHLMGFRLAGCRNIHVTFHHPQIVSPGREESINSAIDSCKSLIVTTDSNRQFVLDHKLANPDQVKVVAPGIADPVLRDKSDARNRLGLPVDKFVVGTLSRHTPEKRIDLAIEACALADPEGSKIHFALGGFGNDTDRLAKIAQDKLPGRHTFIGKTDDLSYFYSSLDAFVLLSELEGFGLVYSEAGSYGVPSIACRTGGTPDAIQDGSTGRLVDVANPLPDAAKTLTEWISNPNQLERLGKASLDFVDANYSRAAMTRRHAELFRSLR